MILVTGSTGYLGQAVMREFHRRQVSAWVLHQCDLRKPVTAADVLSLRPDVVLHLAARVPKAPADYHDRVAAMETVQMLTNALVSFPEARFLLVSSHVAADPASSAYATGKAMCELALRLIEDSGHLVVRLPGLFGLPRRSGTIYDAALRGEIADSYGPYPAMHVEDAAQHIVDLALSPACAGPVRVRELSYPVGQLARRVAQFARELAS